MNQRVESISLLATRCTILHRYLFMHFFILPRDHRRLVRETTVAPLHAAPGALPLAELLLQLGKVFIEINHKAVVIGLAHLLDIIKHFDLEA